MIEDKNFMQPISEMLLTINEATKYLIQFIEQEQKENFYIVAQDMLNCLKKIKEISKPFKESDEQVRLTDACQCALDSLNRIVEYFKKDKEKAAQKIEFELIPILETAYIQFRYWGCAYPDQTRIKQFKENELKYYNHNPYINVAKQHEQYKYEVSILVVAYNKLEYTKMCVESVLKNIPNEMNYELILFNHGSDDGTKEYFETINPSKQVDISINGAVPGVINKIIQGKYYISISNDIIMTHNSIYNLISCIKSNKNIGWVVPTTPNVSNLQTIASEYHTLEEMHEFACKNNKLDFRRHEQRVRLCNPVTVVRSDVQNQIDNSLYLQLYCCGNVQSFPDDKCSLWLRRNGYKLILANDAFCYHFGSITLKDDEVLKKNQHMFYYNGRKFFIEEFGIDPWNAGVCYDPELINNLFCRETEEVFILGINCGLGGNPLKIKEKIKENTGNVNTYICNTIQNDILLQDLKGVSNDVLLFSTIEELNNIILQKAFNYIIIEEEFRQRNQMLTWFKKIYIKLPKNCCIAIKLHEQDQVMNIVKHIKSKVLITGRWVIINKL